VNNIEDIIPHRKPFLFVDRLIHLEERKVICEKIFTLETNDFYNGHYPGNPITPGVLLCETVFQTAAILILKNFPRDQGIPILAKIEDARFKSIVKPNEILKITAELEEKYNSFFLMKGFIQKGDGTMVLKIKFSLALAHSS
jgi:3-hydroxyacyl-[acyl-carrier-protein] dehydratase